MKKLLSTGFIVVLILVGVSLTLQSTYAIGRVVSGVGMAREDLGGKPKHDLKFTFVGFVYEVGDSYKGRWKVKLKNVGDDDLDKSKFKSTEIVEMNFFEDPACDAFNMTAMGKFDGDEGYKMIFRGGDSDGPGQSGPDTVRVTIYDPEEAVVYDSHDPGEFSDESSCVGTARTGVDKGNLNINI